MDPEGGNQSLQRLHADSLTYSPYPSTHNILLEAQQPQQQHQFQKLTSDSLGPRRGLFSELNTEEASADFLDVQSVSSAGDSEASVNNTQKKDTYQHTESQQPQQAEVDNKTVSALSPVPTSTDRGHQSSTVPVPVHTPPPTCPSSGNNPFDPSPHPSSSELSHPSTHPQHHTAVPHHPSRDSLPGNSTAFVDVLTPPPDYSPLPERGLGTWSAVRGTGTEGTGTQLDYDSDQSEYAI